MSALVQVAVALNVVLLVAEAGCGGKIRAGAGEGDENESSPAATSASTEPLIITPHVATGANHACRLGSNGVVMCWGQNGAGQLGVGTISRSEAPGRVLLSGKAIAIGAGIGHTCALLSTGDVWCWGDNQQGQLASSGETVPGVPIRISSLGGDVQAIAVGDSHTCALSKGGGLKCWGHAAAGQLGDGLYRLSSSEPVAPAGLTSGVVAIAAGTRHSCALLNGGVVKCWGENTHGTLGDNTSLNSNTPIVSSVAPQQIEELSLGTERTCARTAGGALYCWGRGTEGELGDGLRSNSPLPVLVRGVDRGASRVATGAFQTCALMQGGNIRCWGWKGFGAVSEAIDTPEDIPGIGGATSVAVGAGQACALLRDESVMCWGSNYAGALGGESADTRTPVKVEF